MIPSLIAIASEAQLFGQEGHDVAPAEVDVPGEDGEAVDPLPPVQAKLGSPEDRKIKNG